LVEDFECRDGVLRVKMVQYRRMMIQPPGRIFMENVTIQSIS